MARTLLILLALLAALVVISSVMRTLGAVVQSGKVAMKEASVPKTVKKISYVLLIVLMFGVVTGWLGGL